MPSRRRGQVIERGPHTFLIRLFIGKDGKGRRKYSSKTVHGTRKEADQALTAMLSSADSHTFLAPHTETVGAFFEAWLSHRPDLAPSTAAGYLYVWRRYYEPELGHLRLLHVSTDHVQGALTRVQAKFGLSGSTIRQHVNLIRAGFNTAIERRKLLHSPARALLLPKPDTRERECFTPLELRSFFAGTKDTWLGPMWLFLGTTGMRPGEVCALTWDDLHGDSVRVTKGLSLQKDGSLQASPTKTGKMRSIVLPASTLNVIAQHRKRMREAALASPRFERRDLVFPNTRGRQYTPTVLNHLFAKEVQRLGLKPVPLYSLRHAHATDLLSKGVHPKIVAERLGHSSVMVTLNTYSHVLPDIQAESMVHFDKTLDPHPSHGAVR